MTCDKRQTELNYSFEQVDWNYLMESDVSKSNRGKPSFKIFCMKVWKVCKTSQEANAMYVLWHYFPFRWMSKQFFCHWTLVTLETLFVPSLNLPSKKFFGEKASRKKLHEWQDLPDTKNGFRGGGVHTDFIQTIIDIWDITASQSTVCKIFLILLEKWGSKPQK